MSFQFPLIRGLKVARFTIKLLQIYWLNFGGPMPPVILVVMESSTLILSKFLVRSISVRFTFLCAFFY